MKRTILFAILSFGLICISCAKNPLQDYLDKAKNIENYSGVYAIDIDFDAISYVYFGHESQNNYIEYFNSDQFDWEQMDSIVHSVTDTAAIYIYVDSTLIDEFNEDYKAWIDNDLPYDELLDMSYQWCIVTNGSYFVLAKKEFD